jgi:hypothetical protein
MAGVASHFYLNSVSYFNHPVFSDRILIVRTAGEGTFTQILITYENITSR